MIKTKRWDEPREADDGFRLLICRYRPRALPKKKETWDLWWSQLGPSKELHAAFYGKHGQTPITWEEYRRRYLEEMQGEKQQESIAILAEKIRGHDADAAVFVGLHRCGALSPFVVETTDRERGRPPAAAVGWTRGYTIQGEQIHRHEGDTL